LFDDHLGFSSDCLLKSCYLKLTMPGALATSDIINIKLL